MQRVLDIDLDFFVQPVAVMLPDDGPRLSGDDYSVCSPEAVLAFLREQCGLDGKRPGWVITHHDEAFWMWRDAIDNGLLQPRFHVTHVDAHADLGLGDAGFVHLITDVMPRPVEQRSASEVVQHELGFGNWLAFAAACQWVNDLDYVFCPGGGSDLMPFHLSTDRQYLELKAATREQLKRAQHSGEPLQGDPDPRIPLRQIRAEEFGAEGSYDAIVLSQSPGYTPEDADVILDLIRDEFIEDIAP